MPEICCIGHITLDKIVTPRSVKYMAGGTSFYLSNAVSRLNVDYQLITAVAETEMHFVEDLEQKGVKIKVLPSTHSVCFENIYAEDQDHRTQRVSQKADPFLLADVKDVEAKIIHLGVLLADDLSVEVIEALAKKSLISLDVQGYLRRVENGQVLPTDWPDKLRALKHIHTLKANDTEAEVLTGTADLYESAKMLAAWGVKEVVITLGSQGSLLYADDVFYQIPAYKPSAVIDATGCGDTYMAGYLYKRVKGAGVEEAGKFAAAMASIKIQASGPFTGNEQDVLSMIQSSNNG